MAGLRNISGLASWRDAEKSLESVNLTMPSGEVKELRHEMRELKEALAEQVLENRLLKKSMIGDGGDGA